VAGALLALVLAPAARAQDAAPIVGSGSYTSAPILEPGKLYRDTILPEEWLYYAIPVQAGQSLHVRATTDMDQERMSRLPIAGLSVLTYDPQRSYLFDSPAQDVTGNGTILSSGRPVEYVTEPARTFAESAGEELEYGGPGTWYVAIGAPLTGTIGGAPPEDEVPRVEIPIELQVDVEGEPTEPPVPTPTATPTATPTPKATPRPPEDEESGAPVEVAVAGVAGLFGGVVLGGIAARRRRS
jgi:MYXO-CTERM domain-containing protein